jgi:hypothetical protein
VDFKKASFGELFGTTFVVGAAFQGALFVLGLVMAILNPGWFHSGPPGAQVAASSPVQAIGVLVLLSGFGVILNLMVASGGAGLIVAARSFGLIRSTAKS